MTTDRSPSSFSRHGARTAPPSLPAIASALATQRFSGNRGAGEVARIDAEARRVGESLDRYFHAFEEGTMPESACGPRIEELSGKLRGLEARRAELSAEEPEGHEPLSAEDLALLVAHVREVIEGGDPPTRKVLLQSLVEEIRVVSRSEIYPSFFCPRFDHRKGQCPRRDSNPRRAA